jgi:hypothetical protein
MKVLEIEKRLLPNTYPILQIVPMPVAEMVSVPGPRVVICVSECI